MLNGKSVFLIQKQYQRGNRLLWECEFKAYSFKEV